MESRKYTDITLSELALQRKVSYAIIFGGTIVMAILIAMVGLFVKKDVDLAMIVLVTATILSIIPSILKLNKINAIIKAKESGVVYSRS